MIFNQHLNLLNNSLDLIKVLKIFLRNLMNTFSNREYFEILSDTSELYDPLWSSLYQASFKDNYDKQSYIQHISVGDTHSLSCSLSSKLHTWGWNDYGQLGVPIVDESDEQQDQNVFSGTQIYCMNVPQQIGRITQVSSGSNHTILLDHKGHIWSWGCNNKGEFNQYQLIKYECQLGLNHYESIETPVRINYLMNQKTEFCKVEARQDENYAITKDGKLYHWPTFGLQGECVNYPLEIIIPKVTMKDVSCGHNFVIFLTTNGLLYSQGSENREGQLGIGDINPRKIPTLISSLRDAGEKIAQIDCGFKHTICKTSLGKVYTWGWGGRGQLGHGELNNEVYPRILKSSKFIKDKCLQVVAGHKCCLMLMESRKIYQFGTNSSIDHQSKPVELNIKSKSDKLSQNFYEPVRIQSTWSKTLSIIYVTYGNSKNSFENNVVLKTKTLNNLTQKWADLNIDTIDPPFIEKIANFISEKNMKMPLFKVPPVQFESKVKYNKLKNEIIEANFMNRIEQEYNSAQQYENQEIVNNNSKSQGEFLYIEDPQISQQREILQDINLQQENWEEFQQLKLAESTRDSQVDLNYETYFKNINERERQKQLQLQQEEENKAQQKLNNKKKYPLVKKNSQYTVNEIPSGENSAKNSQKQSSRSNHPNEITSKSSFSNLNKPLSKYSNNSSANNLRNSSISQQQQQQISSQKQPQSAQSQNGENNNNLDRFNLFFFLFLIQFIIIF